MGYDVVVLALSACAFAGSFVTSMSGVGGALVFQATFFLLAAAVPLGSVKVAIAFSVYRSAIASPVTLWFSRKHVPRQMLLPMLPALAVGAPVGQLLVQTLDIQAITCLLGILCLLVVMDALRRRRPNAPLRLACADACSASSTMEGDAVCAEGPGKLEVEAAMASAPAAAVTVRCIVLACATSGFATGVIGAGFGAPGIPFMVLASYLVMHKTTLRGLLAACSTPVSAFAFLGFVRSGTITITHDWPSLLGVFFSSQVGLMMGERAHRRVDATFASNAVLFFLSCASIQMIFSSVVGRLALAACIGIMVALASEQCRVWLTLSLAQGMVWLRR